MAEHVGIGEGKSMDRLFKSNWFVKIISFLIALMLYTVVSSEGHPTQPGIVKQNQMTVNENLTVKYNENKYVVTGYPDTVTIQVKGSSNLLTKAGLMMNRKAYIDLNGKGPGTYSVNVLTDGFPSGLEVSVVPSNISVTIEKKITKQLPVSVELFNDDKVASGFHLGDPIISPDKVEVSGGQKEVKQVAFIRAVLDVKGANSQIDKKVHLNAYDAQGNQLSIKISPATASVQVPVKNPSKKVPIKYQTTGSLPNGLALSSINLSPNEVTITGPKDVLDSIHEIKGISIPLDGIQGTETKQIKVPIPDGVETIDPETVDATITTSQATTKLFKEIPIDVMGLSSNEQITFKNPKNRSVDVVLTGAPNVLSNISRNDIEVYVDVTGLSKGDHTLKAKINVPKYVDATLQQQDIQISLSGNASSGSTP